MIAAKFLPSPPPPPSLLQIVTKCFEKKEKPDRNEQRGYYNLQNTVFGRPCLSERPWKDSVTFFKTHYVNPENVAKFRHLVQESVNE